MSTNSSRLLHLDPLAIALEKRRLAADAESASREEVHNGSSMLGNQPNMDNLTADFSEPSLSSQPTGQPTGRPMGNQPNLSSQSSLDTLERDEFNLLSSLPEQRGDTRVPHKYTDHLCRLLKPDEQAVYSQLYRLSWGWGKDTCFISNPKLSERSNVPITSMKRAVTGLVSKGVIYKTGHTNGFGKEQGVEYRVPSLVSQPNMSKQSNTSSQPNMGNIKETHIKEPHTNRDVRVGSRFSLQECRRYAESLRKDGITNPGGYATKIHRSGEADELIEAFINPKETVPLEDVNQCPDCHGTGFWEPGGAGKGVAKCKHELLASKAKNGKK